ncbi:MAG: ABC transporter permease [Janthinobacterium lividum]
MSVLADHLTFSPARVSAMVTRYGYLLRGSWPRLLDLLYWPTVQLVTWGFIQRFVGQAATAGGDQGRLAVGAGTLIGAVMLWDVLFRGQLGFSLSFLEEMHSRNVGNLFMSPLRPLEFVASLMVMSLIRLALGVVPVTGLAVLFFGFNLWTLGAALGFFFANLMLTSWSVGLVVSGFLLRNGLGAEELAWSFMFLLLPLCCVYYPVAVLPGWLQALSWCLPPTYVFEGLRAALNDHVVRTDLMMRALAINVVLFGASTAAFLWFVQRSREAGTLLQMGE